MIIQKTFSLEQALQHICYSVCETGIPKDFKHEKIICDFDKESLTFKVTLMDKEEVKKTN